MILDVMRTAKTLIEDGAQGLDAAIAVVNAAKGTVAEPMGELHPMKTPALNRIKKFPAFLQFPTDGAVGVRAQDMRRSSWDLTWQVIWRWTDQDYETVAATVEAMVILLERLSGQGTIGLVDEIRLEASGFSAGQHTFTLVSLAFRVQERDSGPLT